MPDRGFGYIEFEKGSNEEESNREMKLLQKHKIKGILLDCQKAKQLDASSQGPVKKQGTKRSNDANEETQNKKSRRGKRRGRGSKNRQGLMQEISASQQEAIPKVGQLSLRPLQERVEKGLDVKIETMREKKTPLEVINAVETNIETLMGRQMDVEKTKETPKYQAYITIIPRTLRSKTHPQTPDMYRKCSQQFWDGEIKNWAESVEMFDPDDPHKSQPTTSSKPTDKSQTSNEAQEHRLLCHACNFKADDFKKFEEHLASAAHKKQVLVTKKQPSKSETDNFKKFEEYLASPAHKEPVLVTKKQPTSDGANDTKKQSSKSGGVGDVKKQPPKSGGAGAVKKQPPKSGGAGAVKKQPPKSRVDETKKVQQFETLKELATKKAHSLGFEIRKEEKPNKFTCSLCKVTTDSFKAIQKHFGSDEHTKRVICPICHILCANIKDHVGSSRHLSKMKEQSQLMCPYCSVSIPNEKATRRDDFQQHLQGKKHARIGMKKQECPVCNFSGNKSEYMAHLKMDIHCKNVIFVSTTTYICKKCNKKCLDMNEHGLECKDKEVQQRRHSEKQKVQTKKNPRTFICSPCAFRCQDAKEYEKHLAGERHRKKEPKTFICSPCDFKCHNATVYEKHLMHELHRRTALKVLKTSQFNCTKCNISMGSFEEYEVHLLSAEHVKVSGGRYYCQVCNIDCKSYERYKYHMSNAENYKDHMASAAALLTHKCQQCRESFPDRRSFDAHRKGDYHDLVTRIKQKEVILDHCTVCNIEFDDLKSLMEHIQDGEHIHIMKISGGIKCLLCSWLPSLLVSDLTRDYWTHLESKEHISQIERLSDVFGSYQNIIFRENDEMYCANCKKTFKEKAKNHKCQATTKIDPKQLCTIVVDEELSCSSCSEKVLKAYFRQFGEIVKVSTVVPKKGIRKTYITYKRVISVIDVLETSIDHDGLSIQGNELSIKQVIPSQMTAANIPCTIFCMNFDPSLTRVDLFNYFSKYGKIKEILPTHGGVIYETSQEMRLAFERGLVADGYSTHTVKGKAVVCCTLVKNINEGKVLLKELPVQLTRINLESYFSRYEYFNSLLLIRDVYSPQSTGFGTVKFCYRKSARTVLKDGTIHAHMGKKFQCVPVKEDDKGSTEADMKDQASLKDGMMFFDEWFEGDLDIEEDSGVLKVPGVDDEEEEQPGDDGKEKVTQKSKWDGDEVIILDEAGEVVDENVTNLMSAGGATELVSSLKLSTSPVKEGQSRIIPEVVKPSDASKVPKGDLVKESQSLPSTFKVPQLPLPGKAKSNSSLSAVREKANDVEIVGDLKVAEGRTVLGVLVDKASAAGSQESDKCPETTRIYTFKKLPHTVKDGDIWQYFRDFGVGEIMTIFIARGKTAAEKIKGQYGSWIRFGKIGPEDDKKLRGTIHAINGGQVKLVARDQDSLDKTSVPVDQKTSAPVDQKEVQDFTDMIPDILAMNVDWKGSSRGIEYVTAGYRCNVCQWFYKAVKNRSPARDRKHHMASEMHANQERKHETEYGVEGVYCNVCEEFVKFRDRQKALDSAVDHCVLLKHHLHVKLHILQNNLKIPKWLQNPLYSKAKKRTFTEETTEPEGKEPLVNTGNQPAPPGLAIVDYGSSDEEEMLEETVEEKVWKDVFKGTKGTSAMMGWGNVGDQPPPPGEDQPPPPGGQPPPPGDQQPSLGDQLPPPGDQPPPPGVN
ncbi:uncharacterized protein [Amphiura filiformis]|uniref:uncharacterized protein n=1 Tax=Amphiura filiformis TaxID=82378 RepID=UPI003B20C99E